MKNKQLYKISKYCHREAFTTATLEMSASNQSKVLEKMKKNKNYMKTQSIVMKIGVVIYLAVLVIFPIFAFDNINRALTEGIISIPWITFSGSLTITSFFLIQILYLNMIGMFFTASILSGKQFNWLTTLPIKREDFKKICFFTFFRQINFELITMALIFPVGVAIITKSFIIIFASVLISLLNTLFSFSLMIIIGEKVNEVMQARSYDTKKNTIARLVVMGGFIFVTMFISVGISVGLTIIENFFISENLPIETTRTINLILSAIPFPTNQAYLITQLYVGLENYSSANLFATLIGFVFFIFITWKLYRKALKLLINSINKGEKNIKISDDEIVKTTVDDVEISIKSPVEAFFKKDKQMATRDIQMLMMIVMPLILPLIGYATTGYTTSVGDDIEAVGIMLSINLSYLIMSAIMIIFGILGVESSGSSILEALPIINRDQAKAKIRWLFIILPISNLIPLVFYIGKPIGLGMLYLTLIIIPIGPIVGMINFELWVVLFGKMKYKYVLDEINIRGKVWKWILIIVLDIFFYIAMLIPTIVQLSTGPFIDGILTLAKFFIPIEIGLAISLYLIFNKLFPKKKK